MYGMASYMDMYRGTEWKTDVGFWFAYCSHVIHF